jgi:WD40-like Beta Propeller Repeat
VRLGTGLGIALSPDGRWALAVRPSDPTKLLMLPTGAGETRQIGTSRFRHVNDGWFPDGKRILFIAFIADVVREPPAAYVQDIGGGNRVA